MSVLDKIQDFRSAIFSPYSFFHGNAGFPGIFFLLFLAIAASVISAYGIVDIIVAFGMAEESSALMYVSAGFFVFVISAAIIETFFIKFFTLLSKHKRSFGSIYKITLFQLIFFLPIPLLVASFNAESVSVFAQVGYATLILIGFFWSVCAIGGLHAFSRIQAFLLVSISKGALTCITTLMILGATLFGLVNTGFKVESELRALSGVEKTPAQQVEVASLQEQKLSPSEVSEDSHVEMQKPSGQEPPRQEFSSKESAPVLQANAANPLDPFSPQVEEPVQKAEAPCNSDINEGGCMDTARFTVPDLGPSAEEVAATNGCEEGKASSCLELGLLKRLNGAEREASSAFSSGCLLGSIESCKKAAEMEALLGNEKRHLMYLRVLCKAGHEMYCLKFQEASAIGESNQVSLQYP